MKHHYRNVYVGSSSIAEACVKVHISLLKLVHMRWLKLKHVHHYRMSNVGPHKMAQVEEPLQKYVCYIRWAQVDAPLLKYVCRFNAIAEVYV